MFGARKGNADGAQDQEAVNTISRENVASPARVVVEANNPAPRTAPAQIAVPPRRVIDIPPAARRSSSTHVPLENEIRGGENSRTLRVGKGLSVAGEITSCDVLVVEGKVEAKLNDGKLLEITESGQFRGSVEIENADIAGRYDGQLIVHGRLTVRSTGRISGMVKYGELEVSAGGQIVGELQVTGANAAAPNQKGGTKYASYADEPDEAPRSERRSA
jgi:cytoskeletal protein CcmA (bactofilin family)